MLGRSTSPTDLLREVLADRPYFEATGGGLTVSGGEPLLQAEGVEALLAAAQRQGLHTTLETSGCGPWSALHRLLPHADLIYFDLKAADDPRHRELTGVRFSQPIRDNARRLADAGANVVFRMPVVPGHNDDEGTVDGIASLLRDLGQGSIRVLPYHRAGEEKLSWVDTDLQRLELDRQAAEDALRSVSLRLQQQGLEVVQEGRAEDTKDTGSRFPERVWQLREAVRSAKPAVCTERALEVTRYARDRGNRSKPVVIQRAEALAGVLASRSIAIHEDELLVGNYSVHRVGGAIFPELHGIAQCEDLLVYGSREVNPLQLSTGQVASLALRVLPFWATKSLSMRAFPLPRALRFMADQLSARRYVINETGGISHLVPDYETLLAQGTDGIAARAREAAERTDDPQQHGFYRAVEIACEGLARFGERYAELATEMAAAEEDPLRKGELERIAQTCAHMPRHPARNLQEAVQSLLFAQIAINAESLDNSVCPGRLDQLLLPFFQADESGKAEALRAARELIGCLTVKLCELIPVFSRRITRIHGGMFNGQVVVVGGVTRDGKDGTNALTWMFLDAMDQLRMRQPNYHARIHAGSPPAYLARIADMLRRGSGAPSLMNDDCVVPMLASRGISMQDARDYSPVGCVEPVAGPAAFASTDAALVNLGLPFERALGTKPGSVAESPLASCADIDQVVQRLGGEIDALVDEVLDDLQAVEQANADHHPTPLTSMLLRGCLESGVDSTAGGALYNSSGVQGVGVPDLADSLAAIEDVVFRRQLCDLDTLVQALQADFEGFEHLRGQLLRAPMYGNHDPRVDGLADRVMSLFVGSLARRENTRGGPYVAGFYSVTVHRAFGESVGALPSGRRAGRPLANGISPASGQERLGPTAALNSTASLRLEELAGNGINLNLRLDRSHLSGAEGLENLVGLIRGYFAQGGMQLQVNVVDSELLRQAMEDPEAHPWLLVRVSGYSSYFQDLSPDMQREIVERATHGSPV